MKSLFNIFKRRRPEENTKEIKIPNSFLPYRFYEKDFELAKNIKGLSKLGHVDQKPFGPYFYFKVDKSTLPDNFNLFLDTLPEDFLFQFNTSSSSDDGLFTRMIVQADHGKYLYHFYGHGQSRTWKRISRPELLNLFLESRELQFDQSFRVYRSLIKGTAGHEA